MDSHRKWSILPKYFSWPQEYFICALPGRIMPLDPGLKEASTHVVFSWHYVAQVNWTWTATGRFMFLSFFPLCCIF